MKIRISYNFDGASGTCRNCGTHVTLEKGDTGMTYREYESWTGEQKEKFGKTYPVWVIKCPTCDNSMECNFLGDTSGTD